MTFDPMSVEVTIMCDSTQGSLCPSPMKIHVHQSMWIVTLFSKTRTKGHWPLDDLWSHVCWGHMCDSTQGIIVSKSHENTSKYVDTVINFAQWPHTTYYIRTTYRMSDHISYWTQFRRDKNWGNSQSSFTWQSMEGDINVYALFTVNAP